MALKRLIEQSPIFDIYQKVISEKRISEDDALRLFQTNDIHTLGLLANTIREKKNNNYTYYNINRHIDYSNVCSVSCKFCAFSRFKGEEGAYEFTIDEICKRAKAALDQEHITELHIVGGLHPDYPFEWYENMLRALKHTVPTVHLKCFTAVEIDFFANKFDMTYEEILKRLKEAGLDSLPGGGAEIFHEDIRKQICPGKATADQWIQVHETAHSLGLSTTATMLYGHIENYRHRVDHLRRLRELQDKTSGFQTFIPLAFHPDHTALDQFARPSGIEDLKTLAISRIYLDNFPHIKAYWIMLGIKLAQLSLSFGVDDLDGTVIEERIYHMAGADTPEIMTVSQLQKLIREVGRIPVERDTLYKSLKVQEIALV
jgi:aminodeoxyfutalosine synthase